MKALALVHPFNLVPGEAVSVDFSLSGNELVAQFEVRGAPPHVNPRFSIGVSQHGLWDYDVVEVFVRPDPASQDYFEFQVSPLGQFFELQVHEPRKRTNPDFRSGFTHRAKITGAASWTAELRIPLAKLGWDGRAASITGGAFAILGMPPARTYWALSLPQQDTPDFHLPRHFKPLLP